ncbi:MAG: hypothetical protein KY447_03220 [Actinobacteria bacterium]|nr:hypothetical protein [Actinomycetota bacterium]MBW3641904.1 hypothetical protein [Actinomycetota bacterium]
MAGTTVALASDGRAVVVKRGAAERLGHEARMLRLAASARVVELAEPAEGCDEPGDDGVLCSVFVGGGTLAEQLERPLDGQRAVEVAASLATTVADLHELGIAHCRLSADHVLVADGSVVLCGLAEARLITQSDRPVADDDVVALAGLVEDLAHRSSGAMAAALARVARRILTCSAEDRPSIRSVARTLVALVDDRARTAPESRRLLPRRNHPQPRRSSPPRRRPAALAAGAVLVLGGLALGLSLLGSASGDTVDVAVAPSLPPSPSTSAPVPTTSTPPSRRLWPRSTCPEVAALTVADLDGDGCGEKVELSDGVVSSAGRRWQVAAPNDVVTLGDWDCDGTATPAVLRGGSGELWVYARWAELGHDVGATLVGVVPTAVSARTVTTSPEATGCDRIEVVHPDDRTTIVTP